MLYVLLYIFFYCLYQTCKALCIKRYSDFYTQENELHTQQSEKMPVLVRSKVKEKRRKMKNYAKK